jgi:bacterioferritin
MATNITPSQGILSPDRAEQREQVVEMLKKAYWMEIETVISYITNSTNPDGVRAQEIIESLKEDVQEELGHAQEFANRTSRPSSPTSSRPTTRPTSSTSSRA